MQAQTQRKPYTILNEDQYPFLKNVDDIKKAKQHGLNQKTWQSFLKESGTLFSKWFRWNNPEYMLVEINQKNRTVKFYDQHSTLNYLTKFSKRDIKAIWTFSQFRDHNQEFEIRLKKNYINGSFSPTFVYTWGKYTHDEALEDFRQLTRFGVKFNLKKWLNNSLTTNEKKIFLQFHKRLNVPSLYVQKFRSTLYLANRSNCYQSNENNNSINQSIIKPTCNILGYGFTAYNRSLGLQLSLKGGYDYFNNYNFNKLIFKFGDFKEYEKHVIQMSVKAGTVIGKNLMQNDLLSRNKSRWNDDRSVSFLNTRLNFFFKNFHPIFGGVFQIVPFFYLEGCASKNLKQVRPKFELDYGIGLRFLSIGLTLDTSLLKMGKNLDEINPSFRIIF